MALTAERVRKQRPHTSSRRAAHPRPRPRAHLAPTATEQPVPVTPAGRRLPGVYAVVLGALSFGVTLGLAIVVIALVGLRPPANAASSAAAATKADRSSTSGSAAATAPNLKIAIQTRHTGLRLHVRTRLTTKDGRPVRKASISAFTDMLGMSFAHPLGPFQMLPQRGQPGVYAFETRVPMVGRYDVRVQVDAPVAGKAHKEVLVSATNR
jgi:hypothetical protein